MSTKALIIIAIAVAVLAIASGVMGALRPAPKHSDPAQQQEDIAKDGTGSSLTGIGRSLTWAQPEFPLDQVTIGTGKAAVQATKRQIDVPAKGTVTIMLAKITGSTVRQFTIGLSDQTATTSPPLVTITYLALGPPPAGVNPDAIPPASFKGKVPTLPATTRPSAAADWQCALPIYPGGAVVTLRSEATRTLSCAFR